MVVYLLTAKAVGCGGDLVLSNRNQEVLGLVPALCNVFNVLHSLVLAVTRINCPFILKTVVHIE